ncbi:hypothetical protein J6590_038059 [Homalodisca vitripennis]|nr:hypothetical protein J6590_038059 [Homalodisca vitripennis]
MGRVYKRESVATPPVVAGASNLQNFGNEKTKFVSQAMNSKKALSRNYLKYVNPLTSNQLIINLD